MVPNWPIFKAFWAFKGAKIAQHGLNMGSFHLCVHPKWSKSIFGKTDCSSIFDCFLIAKKPIFKAFCDFGVAKTGCNALKKDSFPFFVHLKCPRTLFRKIHFDPFLVAKQPIFKACCCFGVSYCYFGVS